MAAPAWLHSIRQWLEVAAVIAILILVGIYLLNHGSFVEGKLNDNSGNISDALGKIDEQEQKITNLESMIRQQQTHTTTVTIPEALAEKDIDKSMQRMQEAW
jgi:hypothetical protein